MRLTTSSLTALALVVAAGCGSDAADTSEPPTTVVEPTTTESTTTSTVADVPTTVPVDPTVPTDDDPRRGAIDLRLDAGATEAPAVFGVAYGSLVDPDDVVDRVGEVLGAPAVDTGWAPWTSSYCAESAPYRSILWDDLRIVLRQPTGDVDSVSVAAWSLGDPSFAYAPPLDATISGSSGITTTDGLGLGSPRAAIDDVPFLQVGPAGGEHEDVVLGLAHVAPVQFRIGADDTVEAMWIEDNDC